MVRNREMLLLCAVLKDRERTKQMYPWSFELSGRYEERIFASEVLKNNPLGDPYTRPIWVYLPPGYDKEPTRRYPSVYMIQGLTGQLDMWRNRSPFRKNFPELADELFARGEAPPCILVWVDCWTTLGQPVRRLSCHRALPHLPL